MMLPGIHLLYLLRMLEPPARATPNQEWQALFHLLRIYAGATCRSSKNDMRRV